ncbi:MAG: sodium:proline symporter [Gammaproteobacteria bacterium]|nr:MAG: sodium:proline symporter [Gammaproteobacteria bacterium]
MNTQLIILITLIVYKVALIAIGFWASRRTVDEKDFFLAGGSLGPAVAALSASASSSSAWTLLGVSGAAYQWGFSAIWLFPAVLGGFAFNWFWVAPRLYKKARQSGHLTLTAVLAEDKDPAANKRIVILSSLIVLICFVFYVAAQFDAAGSTFVTTFDANREWSIILGAGIILFYTLMGGFWAVSVTDSIQGFMMALSAIILPSVAVYEVLQLGGFSLFWQALVVDGGLPLTLGFSGALGVAFVLGTLGIGFGYPGQPHVVNRFMALKNEQSIKTARQIALVWAVIIYSGMILLGFSGRVLVEANGGSSEQILMVLANSLLHPLVAGILLASVLSAIMSTADSMLLTAGAAVSHDLKNAYWPNHKVFNSLLISRLTITFLCGLAVLMAIFIEQTIYARVLFAWSAIGAAFGPLLLFRLSNRSVDGWVALLAIFIGFSLTLVFYWQENTPGDYLERLVPFFVSMTILFMGYKFKSNKFIRS